MKNKSILTTFLLSVTLVSFSQSKIGFYAGLNRGTLSDDIDNYIPFEGINSSFHIGALFELKVIDRIMFRPKIEFSQQGDRKKTSFDEIDDSKAVVLLDYKLSYINLPLTFKFFKDPAIIFGPQLGYLINTNKQSFDYGNIQSKIDYGAKLGILFEFNKIFFEANLYQGFNRIIDTKIPSTPNNQNKERVKATNLVFQLSLGYHFDMPVLNRKKKTTIENDNFK